MHAPVNINAWQMTPWRHLLNAGRWRRRRSGNGAIRRSATHKNRIVEQRSVIVHENNVSCANDARRIHTTRARIRYRYYRATLSSAVYAMTMCLSVRPSVRPSIYHRPLLYHKNSSEDEIANVNFFTTASYM